MKNGPVFSNITMINKCFSDIGSPLPYSMILDYLRMNWANGRGISEKEASTLLNLALNANYYYTEITPQHYQRKSQIMDELDSLYERLSETYIPINYNNKKMSFTLQKIYKDSRFSIITTDDGVNYILLSDWNLLNDLAIKLLNTQIIKQPTINKITQLIKDTFNIEDKNALFIPHIDNRFVMKKDGTVILSEFGYSSIDFDLKVEVTLFIREEIARTTPEILKILEGNIGIQLYIKDIIKEIYKLEIHRSAYPAYFEALKEYLKAIPGVYFQEAIDKVIYLPKEISPDKIDTFRFHGSTDKESIDALVDKNNTLFAFNNETEESSSNPNRSSGDKLLYTLRYYDRIQETLSATYFTKWIIDDSLHIQVLDDEIDNQYIFFYDKEKNILYGSQIEEFMCDYALEPGQKLEFTYINDKLYVSIGTVDLKAAASQERYLDIGKISVENSKKHKSLVQLISETLIYHPSGLHLSEITKYVLKNSFCAESSISSTLSNYDFFQKHPHKLGFWVFNPNKWRKSEVEKSIEHNEDSPDYRKKIVDSKIVNEIFDKSKKADLTPVIDLEETYKKIAYTSTEHKNRILNDYFKSWSKEKILISSWHYYAFLIYNLAKNYSTPAITPMDLIQESYFALDKAYKNYDIKISKSFYQYCKIYLKSRYSRYIGDKKNLIRIPAHKADELKSIIKLYELNSLLHNNLNISDNESNLIIWNIDYISFEQLYAYCSLDTDTFINDSARAASSYPFLYPLDYEDYKDQDELSLLDISEPDELPYPELLYEDNYNLDSSLADEIFDYLKSLKNHKKIPLDDVLKLRSGLTENGKIYTLEEIGQKYNVTRERIRQIEERAKSYAKAYLRKLHYHKEP